MRGDGTMAVGVKAGRMGAEFGEAARLDGLRAGISGDVKFVDADDAVTVDKVLVGTARVLGPASVDAMVDPDVDRLCFSTGEPGALWVRTATAVARALDARRSRNTNLAGFLICRVRDIGLCSATSMTGDSVVRPVVGV